MFMLSFFEIPKVLRKLDYCRSCRMMAQTIHID
jgi:ribosomal protein S26